MKKRNFFFKHFLTPIFIGLIISAISFYVLRVLAAPPDSAYAPGATLNPSCAPGSANCTVTTPAISGANSDITSLAGLTTALTASQGGSGQTSYTKGDLLVASSSAVLAKLTVGSDGKVLTASSTATYGVSWESAGAAGITSLNGLSGATQTFASSTSGVDFLISSSGTAHTFQLPSASVSARGLLTSTDWDTFNNKQSQLWGLSGSNLFASSTSWSVGIGTSTPGQALTINGGLWIGTSTVGIPTLYVASTTGRVGIGTSTPTGFFEAINLGGGTFPSSLTLTEGTLNYSDANGSTIRATGGGGRYVYMSEASGVIDLQAIGATLSINRSGNNVNIGDGDLFISNTSGLIGIATTTPSEVLTINGGLWIGTSTVGIPTLYVASTTGRVGIGTSTPGSLLDVAGIAHLRGFSTSTAGLYVDGSGTLVVGIGTTTPSSLLELSQDSSAILTLTVSTSTTSYDPYLVFRTGATPATKFVFGVDYSDSNKFKIATSTIGTNDVFVIDQSGNIGIGTSSPAALLHLFGTANALRFSYDASNYATLSAAGNGDLTITNSTTTESSVIVGNGTASQDVSLRFDGQNQDYYLGLDNSDSDKFMIGLGSAIGTTPYLTILSTGLVGIGTTTPAYGLQIAGDIVPTANSLYSLGTSTLKWSNIYAASSTVGDLIFGNDFRFVEDYETPQALILKNQNGEEVMRVDENGNMILIGSISSNSTQASSSQTGEAESSEGSSFIERVKNALVSLGLAIENGVARLKELITDKLTAKTARIEKLEMVDKATGEIYCNWIENGEWQKTKGECQDAQADVVSAPIEQTVSDEPVISDEPTITTELQSESEPESALESASESLPAGEIPSETEEEAPQPEPESQP